MSVEIQTEIDYLLLLQNRGNTDPFLGLKLEMLRERIAHHTDEVNGRKRFQTSATKSYLLACVARYPGLTRSELRELAGIPGSPKRPAVDVFRDYLTLSRRELFVDADGRHWIKSGFNQPPIAKIGKVVLDGRITPKMKKALCFLRDNPGASVLQLRKVMRLNNPDFRALLSSLKNKMVQDDNGALYVDGYIPETIVAELPDKQKAACPSVMDAIASSVLEEMIPGVSYEWGQIVPVYKGINMTGREGLQHIMKLVAAGVVRAEHGKFVNVRSDI